MAITRGKAAETVGERLRRLRLERRLTQRELAAPGVSYAYISRIEAGSRQPSVKALRKLARKLGVPAEYLETGSELGDAEERELRLVDAELELRLAEDSAGAEEALARLLREALAAGDLPAVARARIGLGMAAALQGRHADAVARLQEAIESGLISPVARPDVYATLGRAYAAQGDQTRAAELWEGCLHQLAEDAPDDIAARTRFATYLSYALADLGELSRAQEVLRDAIRGAEHFADPYTQIRLYWSLARLAAFRGNLARALGYGRRAIALLEATEDTLQLARAHLLCAGIVNLQGKAAEALPHLGVAEQLLGFRAAAFDLASLRTEQARAAARLGRADEAVTRAREALTLLEGADPAEQGSAWCALAEGLALEGETAAADEAFGRGVDLLARQGRWRDAAQACRAWGKMLKETGREAEALDVLERAADLAVQSGPAEARPER